MKSVFEYFSNSGYTFIEYRLFKVNEMCHTCNKSVEGCAVYWITDTLHNDTQSFFIHATCSELPISVYLHEHPLSLKEDFIFAEDAACKICSKPIAGSPTYTCIKHDVDVDCKDFYLHKICAELPMQIIHHKHILHPLPLLPRPDDYICSVCAHPVKTCYACDDCEFDVCVFCAFEQRVLNHEGHKEHTLTLIKKESLFQCDACQEEAKDSFYVCTTCEFLIHKSCAFSPSVIPDPTYHNHPLTLVYSIPDIHRYFRQFCGICHEYVGRNYWVYYCDKCTYFVHMKCSTSTVSMGNKDEADDIDDENDLVQFPLPSQESMFEFIASQASKFQVDFQGKAENSVTISTPPNDPHMIENHWSHRIHPLEQLHLTICENGNYDNDDDARVLICDGCIQPITALHPSYYACIQCGFFLHSFCATRLPQELPVGASPFHPNCSLLLRKEDIFYKTVICGVCCLATNGFYYRCQNCDINIDIFCAFLPTRLKHNSHKHHSLIQREFSDSLCSVTRIRNWRGVEYACETCSSFQIHLYCVLFPIRMDHEYESHPITLRYPPFFYEGVFYCEICEERVDNQKLLYHCTDSEHSFHYYCLVVVNKVKLGGTIKVIIDDKLHPLALVLKRHARKNSTFICYCCFAIFRPICLFFECDGCGFLVCLDCAGKFLGQQQLRAVS